MVRGESTMTAPIIKDLQLRRRAEAGIPGGMYGHQSVAALPDDYPQFFARGAGANLWDVHVLPYLDLRRPYAPHMSGYAHNTIAGAAFDRSRDGGALTC